MRESLEISPNKHLASDCGSIPEAVQRCQSSLVSKTGNENIHLNVISIPTKKRKMDYRSTHELKNYKSFIIEQRKNICDLSLSRVFVDMIPKMCNS